MVVRLPSEAYSYHLKQENLKIDHRQLLVLRAFDQLYQQLGSHSFLRFLRKPVKGIYLWGSVGVGKTFLMDCFYESLPTLRKQRIHFHHFMQDIHAQLRQFSGKKNPLTYVAQMISEKIDVLCLDEFFVSDIVDAMLLAGLLSALFEQGICFITTSNIPPDQLYKDGLRRDNFLPAIKFLEENTQVINLNSNTDYRLHHLNSAGVYYSPLDAIARKNIEAAFIAYSNGVYSTEPITILSRALKVIKRCETAVWFSFDVLCGEMRSKQDYLEIAQEFPLVFLSDVPVLTHRSLDEVILFIRMIDIFYDAKIKLIISADTIPQDLYTEGRLVFDFQRIISRLIEMQSEEYFNA